MDDIICPRCEAFADREIGGIYCSNDDCSWGIDATEMKQEKVMKIFIFEVDGIRVSSPKLYEKEPTKDQVLIDMQEWFFEKHHMWFSIKEDGIEKNLEDWI